jgi:hypothetical protein
MNQNQVLLSAGLLLIAGACAPKAPSMDTATRRTEVQLDASAEVRRELSRIDERVPEAGYQVWLKKDYWLNRKIWVSLGVERASVTGLAMSVDGFTPAIVTRSGNLLVLMRDNEGLFGGSVLGPDIPLNGYPIVSETDDEIQVDLAAPKTPYGLTLSRFNAGSYADTELAPRFEFVKSVETTNFSLSFTSVSTTKSPMPLFDVEAGDTPESIAGQDPYLLSMTMRTDWIVPSSNGAYVPTLAEEVFGFFTTPTRLIDGGLNTRSYASKIALNKPFVWELSSNTPDEYVPALTSAVTTWNSSLEAQVLQVRKATEAGSNTKPTVSNLLWDDNELVGFAFANWRTNPATGEIVQAQVYMSGNMWASNAEILYMIRDFEKQMRFDAAAASNETAAPASRSAARSNLASLKTKLKALKKRVLAVKGKSVANDRRFFLGLNQAQSSARARSNQYCLRSVELDETLQSVLSLDAQLDATLVALDSETAAPAGASPLVDEHGHPTHMPYPAEGQTVEQFRAAVVRAVVMHEVGHTLGLRHNFAGSLGTSAEGKVGSASIMDYNDLVIDSQFEVPGDSDKAVVQLGYLGRAAPESLQFCTDEQADTYPGCKRFDFAGNDVLGHSVSEESNLILSQFFLSTGNVDLGIDFIYRALGSAMPLVEYVTYSAENGVILSGDQNFAQKQALALQRLELSFKMLRQAFPADFVAIYREILIEAIAQSVTPDTAASSVIEPLQALLTETALDAAGGASLATRLAAVRSLRQLQSLPGRALMTQVAQGLEASALNTTRSQLDAAEDQDLLILVKRILFQEGYFLVAGN